MEAPLNVTLGKNSLRRREFLQLSVLGSAWTLAPSFLNRSLTQELVHPQRDDDPRHLFLDSRLIANVEGIRVVLGKVEKDPHNPLFGQDKPWEPRFDNLYPNVLYDADENIYKCWYTPYLIDPGTTNTPREMRPYRNYVESDKNWAFAMPRRGTGLCGRSRSSG